MRKRRKGKMLIRRVKQCGDRKNVKGNRRGQRRGRKMVRRVRGDRRNRNKTYREELGILAHMGED